MIVSKSIKRSLIGICSGVIVTCLSIGQVDVLGDFDEVTNGIGYLDFGRTAQLYKGNIDLPEIVEGIQAEARTPSAILYEDYLDHETGEIKTDAILGKMVELATLEVVHFESYCEEREDDCAEVSSEVYSKWQGRRKHVAYQFAYDRLKEALDLAHSFNAGGSREGLEINLHKLNDHTPEVLAFKQALFEGLEVFESLALDHAGTTKRTNKLSSILSLLKYNTQKHHIESGRVEAANLLIPENKRAQFNNQTFFSPDQIESYDGDWSLLDPPDSGFWRKPGWSISAFNTTNFNRTGMRSLAFSLDTSQAEAILDKSVPVKVIYEKSDLSGRTPKVDVLIGGQTWKLKYVTHRRGSRIWINPSKVYQKRWLGSEVHVEPVVNNLAAAIGYTVDPTYYQEKVHLYLQKKAYKGTPEEQAEAFEADRKKMIENLTEVFPSANIQSAFENVQIDENGQQYIEVRQVTLEKKSDSLTDLNIGYYRKAGFGKSFKREFRAFSIFLAWIADSDIKDANVKAKLVPITKPDGSPSYRLVYSASDMGGALGTGFPNLFKKDFVDKLDADSNGNLNSMRLTYRSIFPAPLLKVVSVEDYRWIARMIGQFTREQIYDAFSYAGYPEVVAQYYTEVLLRRRDQLVRTANLMGEKYTDQFGVETIFEPLSEMTSTRRFEIEGYESYFKRGKLRDKKNKLHDATKEYFPRYWGSKYPF